MIRMLPQVSDSNARLAEGTMVAGLIDVRKTYATAAGTVEALAGVSVAFAPGSFTAVMGPSGLARPRCCSAPPGSTK